MKLAIALGGVILAAATVTPAYADTITFDTYSPQNGCDGAVIGGLTFSNGPGAICTGVWTNNPVSTNGTPGLIYGDDGASLTIDPTAGGSFTIVSFLAGISWYSAQTTYDINYTFDLLGGGQQTGTFTIGQGFENYVFNTGDLTHALFSGLPDGYVAIDDFVTSVTDATVPEPATWGMMILGFGVLGATMRRRPTKVAFAA